MSRKLVIKPRFSQEFAGWVVDIFRLNPNGSMSQLTSTGWSTHDEYEVVNLNPAIREAFGTEFLLVQNEGGPTVKIISNINQALKGENNG